MSSIPQPMPIYASPIPPGLLFDKPPSGGWIVSPTSATAAANVAGLNNLAIGCHVFVPVPVTMTAAGFNVSVAGDATAVCFLSLYEKVPGAVPYNLVLAEQQFNVAATTGLQIVSGLSVPLPAGRYAAFIRSTASVTQPTYTGTNTGTGLELYATDQTEAASDFTRGGIHPSQVQLPGGPYGVAAGPIGPTFTLIPGTRSIAPRVFLQVA